MNLDQWPSPYIKVKGESAHERAARRHKHLIDFLLTHIDRFLILSISETALFLNWIYGGKSERQLADELNISPRGLRYRLEKIREKLKRLELSKNW